MFSAKMQGFFYQKKYLSFFCGGGGGEEKQFFFAFFSKTFGARATIFFCWKALNVNSHPRKKKETGSCTGSW